MGASYILRALVSHAHPKYEAMLEDGTWSCCRLNDAAMCGGIKQLDQVLVFLLNLKMECFHLFFCNQTFQS